MVSVRSYRLGDKILSKELSREYQQLLKPLLEKLIVNGISSKYTRAEREYIFACISFQNECDYCYHMHSKFANSHGITSEQKKSIHHLLTQQLDNETNAIISFATLANNLVKINKDL
jgi:AhpD family alkylhydroperoxidase